MNVNCFSASAASPVSTCPSVLSDMGLSLSFKPTLLFKRETILLGIMCVVLEHCAKTDACMIKVSWCQRILKKKHRSFNYQRFDPFPVWLCTWKGWREIFLICSPLLLLLFFWQCKFAYLTEQKAKYNLV